MKLLNRGDVITAWETDHFDKFLDRSIVELNKTNNELSENRKSVDIYSNFRLI